MSFEAAVIEMRSEGFDIDNIPQREFEDHIWADGILFFWEKNKRLPNARELAEEMFDEWDDPVSDRDAERILRYMR